MPATQKADPWSANCPSRAIIDILASKWVLLLLPVLRDGTKRNGELMRAVDGVSQKMLTQTLRDLEHYGIVTRHTYAEVPPHVEYSLTRIGMSLAGLMQSLDHWVIRHYRTMEKAAASGGSSKPNYVRAST
jgi:DNA-binding HxlR family transcriptional regulator